MGPQAIPGKSLPCLSPPLNTRACAGGRGLCKAELLSLPCPLKPQSTAWAITAGELVDYLWNPFPALEGTGGGAAQKISGALSFCWNKPEAGLAGGLIMFAQPVPQYLPDKKRHQVVQKVLNKAPDEHRHDQTSSSVADLGR